MMPAGGVSDLHPSGSVDLAHRDSRGVEAAVLVARDLARDAAGRRLGAPALIAPERDPALERATRALPPRRRLIVFLRYFADLDYTEIAQATGVSTGAVAATLAQANACLAQETRTRRSRRCR